MKFCKFSVSEGNSNFYGYCTLCKDWHYHSNAEDCEAFHAGGAIRFCDKCDSAHFVLSDPAPIVDEPTNLTINDNSPRVTMSFTDGTKFSIGMTDAEVAQVLVFLHKTHGITLKPLNVLGERVDTLTED